MREIYLELRLYTNDDMVQAENTAMLRHIYFRNINRTKVLADLNFITLSVVESVKCVYKLPSKVPVNILQRGKIILCHMCEYNLVESFVLYHSCDILSHFSMSHIGFRESL